MKTTQKLIAAAVAASLSSFALAADTDSRHGEDPMQDGAMQQERSQQGTASSYGESQRGYDEAGKSAMRDGNAADKPSFSALDANSDGYVSEREAKAEADSKQLTKKWDSLDANKDGRLDESEFARFEPVSSDTGRDDSATGSQGQQSHQGTSDRDSDYDYDTDVEVPDSGSSSAY